MITFNPYFLRYSSIAMACLGMYLPASAQTNNVSAVATESKISAVTLYPGSATVERSLTVSAGTKKLTFSCLPANLDVQSLSISADAGVRIGEFSTLNESNDVAIGCTNATLVAKIAELEDKKAALAVETEAIGYATNYLKAVANKDSQDAGKNNGLALNDPKNIATTVDALRQSAQKSLTRLNEINRQQELLNVALKPLLAERNRIQAGRNSVKSVTVAIVAPRDAELKLKYQINGPVWTPTYRASLDTATGNLQLERQALVVQSTGEDWTDVQLRLSTGQPQRRTSEPAFSPWNIGIAPPPQPVVAVAMMARDAPAPVSLMGKKSRSNERADEAASFDVSVFNNSFTTEFAVPQRITVPSNGQRVTLSLATSESKTKLFVRSHPNVEASAFLIAELPQPEGIWPSGPVQLYRDGAFVGKDTLVVGGKLPLNLSFGRDELVTVQTTPQKDFRSTAGFIGSREQRTINRAYSFENRHRTTMALQVIESSPVSVDEQVKIESQFNPKPDTLAWNERAGAVLWTTTLEAGKSARFNADYTISFPKDARLQESR
jgi:uncharacterized protein (TIGR02231 family)